MSRFALGLAAVLALTSAASAQQTSHDVRIYATDISGLTITSGNLDIPLNTVNALGQLEGSGQATMQVSSNLLSFKISAQLAADYQTGVALKALMAIPVADLPVSLTPTFAAQTLSASAAKDVAVGLAPLTSSGVTIDYTATAPLSVGTEYDETQEVIFTISSTVGL